MALCERAARLGVPFDRQKEPFARLRSFPNTPQPHQMRPPPSHDDKRAQRGRAKATPSFGAVFPPSGSASSGIPGPPPGAPTGKEKQPPLAPPRGLPLSSPPSAKRMLSAPLDGPPAKAPRSDGQRLDSHPSTHSKTLAASSLALRVDSGLQRQVPFPALPAPAAAAAPASLGVPGTHAPAAAFAATGGAAPAPGQSVSAGSQATPAVTQLSQQLHYVVRNQGASP